MRKFALLVAVAGLGQSAVAGVPQSGADRNHAISELIFKNYPPRALANQEEGPVFFSVTLDKDAHPTTCQVTHGSGHPLLDAETCDLIMKYAVFNVARGADGRLVNLTTEGVVNWTLPGHAPAPISQAAAAVTNLPEKQICKKTLKPGYLSVYDRVCMSASDWQQQRNNVKDTYSQMQGKKETPSTAACIDPNGC